MKHYIIDAHNVMHKIPEVERLMAQGITPARTLFMSMLGDYAVTRRSCHFTVVFDGTAKDVKYSSANVAILRSGASKTADELIFDLIRKTRSGGATVVSSDNEITNFARASALDVLPSSEFADLICANAEAVPITDEKPGYTRLNDLRELRRLFEAEPLAPAIERKPTTEGNVSGSNSVRRGKVSMSDAEMLRKLKEKDFSELDGSQSHADEKPAFASKSEIDEYMRLFSEK